MKKKTISTIFYVLVIAVALVSAQKKGGTVEKTSPKITKQATQSSNPSNAAWQLDTNFVPNLNLTQANIKAVFEQPGTNGKMLLDVEYKCGSITCYKIVRILPNGTVDTTFTNPTFSRLDSTVVNQKLAGVQPDGKLIVWGNFHKIGSSFAMNLARLNQNGSHDSAFQVIFSPPIPQSGPPPCMPIMGTVPQQCLVSDFLKFVKVSKTGNILLYSTTNYFVNNVAKVGFSMLNPNGQEIFGFSNPVLAAVYPNTPDVWAVEFDASGNIYIGGGFETVNGTARIKIAKLNQMGGLDTSFNSANGFGGTSVIFVNGIKILGNRLFVTGNFFNYGGVSKINFACLKNDGTLETAFSTKPNVETLSLFPDGKYFQANANNIEGLQADGTSDATLFNNASNINLTTRLPDGRILIAGSFTQINTIPRTQIAILKLVGTGTSNPN